MLNKQMVPVYHNIAVEMTISNNPLRQHSAGGLLYAVPGRSDAKRPRQRQRSTVLHFWQIQMGMDQYL